MTADRRDVLADTAALLTAAAIITAACQALGGNFTADLTGQLRQLAWKDTP